MQRKYCYNNDDIILNFADILSLIIFTVNSINPTSIGTSDYNDKGILEDCEFELT